MHPRNVAKTKEITKLVLTFLAMGGALTIGGIVYQPRTAKAAMATWRLLGLIARWRVLHTVRRLRIQGYIMYEAHDATAPITLTDKGIARLVSRGIIRNLTKRRWDYLWRVVLFDVPNKRGTNRNAFRHALQGLGFYPLQKSVFVHPHDETVVLERLMKNYGLRRHVTLLTAASLGPLEEKVRKHFFDR